MGSSDWRHAIPRADAGAQTDPWPEEAPELEDVDLPDPLPFKTPRELFEELMASRPSGR